VDAVDAARRQRFQCLARIGLQPARAAEARLERERPVFPRETEMLREQDRGAFALRAVRIAARHEELRDAVERHQQVLRDAMRAAVIAHARRESIDVGRVGAIARDEAQARHVSQGAERRGNLVEYRARRRAAGLGKHRDHENSLAFATQRFDGVAHTRASRVQHRERDPNALVRERRLEPAPQSLALDREWRSFTRPDRRIFLRARARPHPQDDAVQDRPPQNARDFDDARISEQSREKGAHIARLEGRGSAGVHEENSRLHAEPFIIRAIGAASGTRPAAPRDFPAPAGSRNAIRRAAAATSAATRYVPAIAGRIACRDRMPD
jgi:hypothetical protein